MLVLYTSWRTYHGNSTVCYRGGIDCAMTRQIEVECESIDRVGFKLILLFNTANFFLTFWMGNSILSSVPIAESPATSRPQARNSSGNFMFKYMDSVASLKFLRPIYE